MKRTAHIIIGDKFVSLGANYIKSPQFVPPCAYDTLNIKSTIEVLDTHGFSVELITYFDLLEKSYSKEDIFIVTQYLLNRFREPKSTLLEIRKRINQLSAQGNHFILMHHFWPYFVFSDVLDITYYKGNKRGWFRNSFSLSVEDNHNTLRGVGEFIENSSTDFSSDEFTFLAGEESKFKILVRKIPKRNEVGNFISYGYQKNGNSYVFLIDIHNTGEIPAHAQYYNLLFRNTIEFLIGDSDTKSLYQLQ